MNRILPDGNIIYILFLMVDHNRLALTLVNINEINK